MAEKNKVIIVNKHYDEVGKIKESSFNSNPEYRKGEIIVSNDPEALGIAITDTEGNVVLIQDQSADVESLSATIETVKTEIEGGIPKKLTDLEDYGELDEKINKISTDVVSGLSADVEELKEKGLTPEALSSVTYNISEYIQNAMQEYINNLVIKKTSESGRLFITESEFEALLNSNGIDDECMYYIYEDDESSTQGATIAGSILEIAGASVNGSLLEIGGSVTPQGVLEISVSKSTTPVASGSTKISGNIETSGTTEEEVSGTTETSGSTVDSETSGTTETPEQTEYEVDSTGTLTISRIPSGGTVEISGRIISDGGINILEL